MEKCDFPSAAWSALVVALSSCWMCSWSVCSLCFAVTGVSRLLDWQLVTLFFPTLVYDQTSKIWSGALLLMHLEYVSTSLMCFCNAFVLCRISEMPECRWKLSGPQSANQPSVEINPPFGLCDCQKCLLHRNSPAENEIQDLPGAAFCTRQVRLQCILYFAL